MYLDSGECLVEAPVDLSHISRFGEIFRAPEPANAKVQVEVEVVRRLTHAAAAEVLESREAEGARLQRDLEEIRLSISQRTFRYLQRPTPKRRWHRFELCNPAHQGACLYAQLGFQQGLL